MGAVGTGVAGNSAAGQCGNWCFCQGCLWLGPLGCGSVVVWEVLRLCTVAVGIDDESAAMVGEVVPVAVVVSRLVCARSSFGRSSFLFCVL